jgi:hypothetical protein
MSRYSTEFLVKIFSKGVIIRGKNPNLYRRDKFGAEIYFYSYGRTSPKGWEVDHSKSVKRGVQITLIIYSLYNGITIG